MFLEPVVIGFAVSALLLIRQCLQHLRGNGNNGDNGTNNVNNGSNGEPERDFYYLAGQNKCYLRETRQIIQMFIIDITRQT